MIRPVSDVASFDLELAFNTPAFLGNASQDAQWRSPPFKALLRQWWRVVRAPAVDYDHRRLRIEEQRLFGAAGEEYAQAGRPQAGRSQVQLRLSPWDAGTGKRLERAEGVRHPEVHHASLPAPPSGEPGRMVDAYLYLGYGPIILHRPPRSFIEPGAAGRLRVRVPRAHADEIARAIQLAAWFGSVGSRSRNGWGSLQIGGDGVQGYNGLSGAALSGAGVLRPFAAAFQDRLASDWPHAVGQDSTGQPAVWRVVAGESRREVAGEAGAPARTLTQYEGFEHWRDVMTRLARIRIGLRTQFKFAGGRSHDRVEDRHVLAYPVTNHSLQGRDSARLANQLCFKVLRHNGRYFGLVYHLPHAMPRAFFEDSRLQPPPVERQLDVWRRVHSYLEGIGAGKASAEIDVKRIRAS